MIMPQNMTRRSAVSVIGGAAFYSAQPAHSVHDEPSPVAETLQGRVQRRFDSGRPHLPWNPVWRCDGRCRPVPPAIKACHLGRRSRRNHNRSAVRTGPRKHLSSSTYRRILCWRPPGQAGTRKTNGQRELSGAERPHAGISRQTSRDGVHTRRWLYRRIQRAHVVQ